MFDQESINRCLQDLVENHDSKVSRTSIETLLTIHRNILYNENDIHYRIIKPENPAFQEKVWSLLPARQFMKKCGWVQAHGKLVFHCDERLIDIIEVLLQNRLIQPDEREWIENTKLITENEEKVREQELRKKAAIQRDKEIAEYEKEKKYKEDLARKVKADIRADGQRRQQLYGQSPTNGNSLQRRGKN